MRDFTLQAYREYLRCLKASYQNFLRIDEYFMISPKPENFCIIRHDVDRNPERALRMAELENQLDLKTTYYFRVKRHTFKPGIMKSISALGHEIGYHYESLSDAKGNRDAAIVDFEKNLAKMRTVIPVRTAAMHGRPFNHHNNLDLWRDPKDRSLLMGRWGLAGEVYLDIDYSDIAYITDTGRSWEAGASNVRDKVRSDVKASFKNGKQLIHYLQNNPHPKLIISIHPERWTNTDFAYLGRLIFDSLTNVVKNLV